MSRRKTLKMESLLKPASRPRKKGLFPADMTAAVDLVDPAGHPLVRMSRLLREPDRTEVTWERDTLRPPVEFDVARDDEGEPVSLRFDCRACQDTGQRNSRIEYADVVDALDKLWKESARGDGTPKSMRLGTSEVR